MCTAPDEVRGALVVGAGRGIGLAVVRHLIASGHRVVATHHTTAPTALEALAGVVAVPLDLTDLDSISPAVTAAHQQVGPIDVLVVAAAIVTDALAVHTRDETWSDTITVDLLAPERLMRAVLPAMADRRWGRVVLVSSVAGLVGSAAQSAYSAAKAGLHGLARQWAAEVAGYGVTINVVAPGAIATEQLHDRAGRHLDAIARLVPARRLGSPDEVAAVVRYLCTDDAGFVNGTVIPVDGGLIAGGGFVGSNRQRIRSAGPPTG